MEIETTIKDLPAKIEELSIPPDTFIKITLNDWAGRQEHGKSKWAEAAERIRSEDYLKGKSKEAGKLFRQFRDEFSF